MVEWLNNNQGFVLSILTAVYVIATILILLATVWSNRIASRAIEHSQELHRQQTRPYVVFDIICDGKFATASLHNYGTMPAFDVAVQLDQEFKSIANRKSTLLRNPIGMVAPGRTISDAIDSSPAFHEKNTLEFSGTVSYSDAANKRFEDRISLDLRYYPEMLSATT